MSALIDGNDDYKAVTVMRVDWDEYRGKQISKDLQVRRQSTLVMFNGGVEVDRLIGDTRAGVIEELFIKALSG